MGYANNGSYQPSNEEKTSVKVHAPPGGKSNFSIGGYGDEPEQNAYGSRKKQALQQSNNSSGAASAFRQQDMNVEAAGGYGGFRQTPPVNIGNS